MYINNLDHMTKMAAMAIYGKKSIQKPSSLKPVNRFKRKLTCCIEDESTMYKVFNHDKT